VLLMPVVPESAGLGVSGQISADYSHLLKWFLPPAWVIGWGYFSYLIFGLEHVTWEGAAELPPAAKWVFLGVGVFGLWWMARYLLPLHRVALQGGSLAVLHWRRERLVPLGEIRSVRWRYRPTWEHAGRVVIETRATGSPGQILFVPRTEKVIEELRALVAKTTRSTQERKDGL
jgi:hypothetical protein